MQDEKLQFYSIFIGEYVQMMTNIIVSGHQQIGEDVFECQDAIKVRGWLVDMDDKYFYFGTKRGDILQSLKQDSVVHIAIVDATDPEQDVLNAMPDPETEEEIN